MNSELSPPTAFPALPVRQRETLEIFDTALKLYRRYFWVLIGWSAVVAATMLTWVFSSILYLFAAPLIYGSVSCCIAAAVRGQKVRFRQCWQFTKPRYWSLVGVIFLSWLILFAAVLALYLAIIFLGVVGYFLFQNAPQPVQVVGLIVGSILVIIFFSLLGMVTFSWMNMVPIVACLEDDKRGANAMSRSLDLLKGNWRRVFGMSLILGLAILAFFAIVGGAFTLLNWQGLRDIVGVDPDSAIMQLALTFGAFYGLFFLLWNPAQTLIIAVLYLDLRVRREALDLEWTAYSSAPPTLENAPAIESSASFSELSESRQPLEETPLSPLPASFAAGGAEKTSEVPGEQQSEQEEERKQTGQEEAGRD